MTRRRCFQRGSLEKRGKREKVWVGRWWEDAIGPDGERARIRRCEVLGTVAELPTKRAAQMRLDERLRPVNSGSSMPLSIWTLKKFIEDRWKPGVYPALKHSTKKFYDNVVSAHLIPAFGETQLRSVSREAVQDFLNRKIRNSSSWKTVNHIRTVFGTILESAVQDDLLTSNPVRKTRMPRRGPEKERVEISVDAVRTILENLPEPSRTVGNVIAMTGMRIGEALALRWRDIDFENKSISIRQSVYEGHFDEPKTRSSKRRIPVGEVVIGLLANLHRADLEPDDLIFSARNGSPISRRNLLNRQLKPVCETLGLKGVSWHWFRHAFASLSASAGASLGTTQALLGHSSPGITRDVYIHPVQEEARRSVDSVEKLIGPKRTQVPDWPEMKSDAIN